MDSGLLKNDLERVYKEKRQGLFSLALAITHSAHQAEDAIHNAFVNVCGANGRAIDDLTAYVFAAVRNAARDLARQRSIDTLPGDALFLAGPDNPEESAANQELLAVATRHIEQLPAEQREVLILKVYGELSFKQIAEILECPLPTVAARYRRVLIALKEQLGSLV